MTSRSALQPTPALRSDHMSDEEVVERVLRGEIALYELLMRRYNQRLYRIARGIVRDEAEAEDVLQETYLRAYQNLEQFEGRSKFSTWLTRIAVYEASHRRRQAARLVALPSTEDEGGVSMHSLRASSADPERTAGNSELRQALEEAVDELTPSLRLAFILRDVEGLSTREAAESLEVSESALKVRLHRARAELRSNLERRFGAVTGEVLAFGAARCDRVVERVMEQIGR